MKQYITLNTTYYITKYNLSNPLFKIIFVIVLTLLLRNILDVSTHVTNTAFCMEEDNIQEIPLRIIDLNAVPERGILKRGALTVNEIKHVTFDPSLPTEDTESLEAYKQEAFRQRQKVSLLRHKLSSAQTRLATYADFKHHYAEYMYQIDRYKKGVEERDLFIDQQELRVSDLIKENQRLMQELNKVNHNVSRFSRILNTLNIFKR